MGDCQYKMWIYGCGISYASAYNLTAKLFGYGYEFYYTFCFSMLAQLPRQVKRRNCKCYLVFLGLQQHYCRCCCLWSERSEHSHGSRLATVANTRKKTQRQKRIKNKKNIKKLVLHNADLATKTNTNASTSNSTTNTINQSVNTLSFKDITNSHCIAVVHYCRCIHPLLNRRDLGQSR